MVELGTSKTTGIVWKGWDGHTCFHGLEVDRVDASLNAQCTVKNWENLSLFTKRCSKRLVWGFLCKPIPCNDCWMCLDLTLPMTL